MEKELEKNIEVITKDITSYIPHNILEIIGAYTFSLIMALLIFLIGKWIDDTQIEFTYQHLNQSLENRLGRCCTTFSLEESKLVGHEKWQWLDTLEQGSSLIREI